MPRPDHHADPCPSCRFHPTRTAGYARPLSTAFALPCPAANQYKYGDDHESLLHRAHHPPPCAQTYGLSPWQSTAPTRFYPRLAGRLNTVPVLSPCPRDFAPLGIPRCDLLLLPDRNDLHPALPAHWLGHD